MYWHKVTKEIKSDMTKLHYLYTEKLFDEAITLFLHPEFCKNFEENYVKRNRYWFHIVDRKPMTNNWIESFHGSIKVHQTYWKKMGIAQFLHRALEIVEERSRE